MKIILHLLLFILLIFQTTIVFSADKTSRWIDLDWDEVPGAKGYDVELFEVIDQKNFSRGVFHTETPHWAKESNPGKYNIKMRALDSRKVPGPWGEALPFVVRLPSAQMIRPLNNEILTASEMNELLVTFQWSNVTGALFYQLVVFNSKNKVILNEITKDIEVKYKLSQIDNYKWYLFPMFSPNEKKDPEDFLSNKDENLKEKFFSIKGQILKTPVLDVEIIKKKGLLFRWNEVFRAETYLYEVFKEEDNKEVKKILNGSTKKHQFAFGKNNLSDGKYIINIKATSSDYQDSESARVIFKIEKDSFEVTNNESINREASNRPLEASSLQGQFGYPSLQYTSRNFETDTTNDQLFRGVTIQGRWRKNISNLRYQNILKFEISQVADSATEVIFFNISETIGKDILIGQSHFYVAAGLRFDSTPFLKADMGNNTISKLSYKSTGPELNLQFNHHWNSFWSNELKSSLFFPLLGLSIPNGGKIKTSLNYELELKLVGTVSSLFDFYSGFNMTSHSIKTLAIVGGSGHALAGDVNEIKYTANYFTFGMEFFY